MEEQFDQNDCQNTPCENKGKQRKKVWDHTVLHTIVTMQEEIAAFQCFTFLEMNHDVENGFKIVEE